jgi:hypothetical protein
MTAIMITLRKIKAHTPCEPGWLKILAATHIHGGDFDKEWPLSAALDHNGLDDTLWALRCLPEHNNLWRMFAVACARRVQHLMTDGRSIAALDVAWRHAHGEATDDELDAARDAAWDAAWAAARDARAAARAAARDARAAAWDAAWAARAAARAAQSSHLRAILDAGRYVDTEAV